MDARLSQADPQEPQLVPRLLRKGEQGRSAVSPAPGPPQVRTCVLTEARIAAVLGPVIGNTAVRTMVDRWQEHLTSPRLRHAVNRATGLAVQRQAFEPGKLSLPDPTPSMDKSAVTASPGGADKMLVEGPPIVFKVAVTANVPEGGTFEALGGGSRIDVGPTQSLLGSRRVGVYHKGGTPAGDKVGEWKSVVSEPARDVQTDPRSKTIAPNVPEPWYSQPQALNSAITTATVSYLDQPAWEPPLKQGDGILTETTGEDRFRTSVAAKPDAGDLVHLRKFNWEVPWAMDIDPAKGAKGRPVTSAATAAIPPKLEGPIAPQLAATWMAFVSIDEAAKLGSDLLLRYIGPAETHDGAAFWVIVDALRKRNPVFTLTVEARKKASLILKDAVEVKIKGPSKTVQKGVGSLGTGGSGTATFRLLELLEPGEIRSDTVLEIEFIRDGKKRGKQRVRYPFLTSSPETRHFEGGTYILTWTLIP